MAKIEITDKQIQKFIDKLKKEKDELDLFYKHEFEETMDKIRNGKSVTDKKIAMCIDVIDSILKIPFVKVPNDDFMMFEFEYGGIKWSVTLGQGAAYGASPIK